MNRFWLIAVMMAVVMTHSASVQAGWFDGKKKNAAQTEQKVTVAVQKAKEEMLSMKPAAKTTANDAPAVFQSVSNPSAPSSKKENPGFLDVSSDRSKWEGEKGPGGDEGPKQVRLSEEETKKLKEEMENLQQGIQAVQSAKQASQAARTSIAKGATVPAAIPKAPARPETFKSSQVPSAASYSGYKK